MDIQTVMVFVMLIGFGLFAGWTFVYRKLTTGESFSWAKFLPTMGIGVVAAGVLYVTTGAIPQMDAILAQIATMLPGGNVSFSVVIGGIMTIYNWVAKKDTNPLPALPTYAPAGSGQPTLGVPFDPGFKVLPAFSEGSSPYEAKLQVEAGKSAVKLEVDWQDGSAVEAFAINGKLALSHKYVYEASPKYTSSTFYPKFVLSSMDGQSIPFNTKERGRCCSVVVNKQ